MADNEQRKYQRYASNGSFRVFTSVSNIAYTVDLKDISKSGAFVKTIHFPRIGEKITFHVLNKHGITLDRGEGRVVRILDGGMDNMVGFAIHFSEELSDEVETMLIDDAVEAVFP